MPTVAEITTNVLAYGFSETNYKTRIQRWIDEGQKLMFRRAELRIERESYEFETTSGIASYALPTNFGRMVSLHNTTTEPHENLQEVTDIKEWDELEEESGEPANYIIYKENIEIWPTPNATYQLTLRYEKSPTSIAEETSSSPSVAEEFVNLLESYCLFKAFGAEGDIELANYHKNIFDTGLVEFVGYMNTDTRDAVRQIEGAWPDNWSY